MCLSLCLSLSGWSTSPKPIFSLTVENADYCFQVVCCGMKNMTEAQCGNLTTETKKQVEWEVESNHKDKDKDKEQRQRSECISEISTCTSLDHQVSTEAASMLEDILLLEHVGPIVLCLLAGPFSDRWHCFILNNHETHRYGRKLPLLLSCLGMSLTYAGYGILVTIDPKHKWVSQPVLLLSPAYHPTIICCLLWESPWEASSLSSSRFFNRMLRFWSKSVESANKSSPINVRCSLPTRATTQTASKKAIESLQGEILSNSTPCFRFIMAEGSVYFGAVAGSYASGLCYAKFGYQVAPSKKRQYQVARTAPRQ